VDVDAGLGRLRRPPASPIDFVGINGALASPAWLVKKPGVMPGENTAPGLLTALPFYQFAFRRD